MKPTLIRVGDHYLINPCQIISIDLKGNGIFLSGTRFVAVSDEDLQKVLEYCTVIEGEEKVIPEIHPS